MNYEKIWIQPPFRDLLAEQKFCDFHRIWDFDQGVNVVAEREKAIIYFQWTHNENPRGFYLKKRILHPVKYLLGSLIPPRRSPSLSFREVQAIQCLQAEKIPTMNPVAWGEKGKIKGLPGRDFAIFEEVVGESVQKVFGLAPSYQRLFLIGALGDFVALLHQKGFYDSVRLQDFIWSGQNLTLIDREVPSPFPQKFHPKKCLKGLAKALYHFYGYGNSLSSQEAISFLHSYHSRLGSTLEWSKRELMEKINQSYSRYKFRKKIKGLFRRA